MDLTPPTSGLDHLADKEELKDKESIGRHSFDITACLNELSPPITIVEPAHQTAPIVFASPHSGRTYPQVFLDASPLDTLSIRKSEDAFVDELFSDMPSLGTPLLCAEFPRAFCDVNREAFELDPDMFDEDLPLFVNANTLRVASGLGTIARVVADGAEIYHNKLTFGDARARIDQLYRPYHAALKNLLERTKDQFGFAILVDCHSMPSQNTKPRLKGHLSGKARKGLSDVVLGDRFGASCSQRLVAALDHCLKSQGLTVTRNDPFAGGFCTEFYGQPFTGIHAVQIEINRGLYMDEMTMERHSGLGLLKDKLKPLVEALTETDLESHTLAAQ